MGLFVCIPGHWTGVACQRQHWTSHKRQCRILAEDELRSSFGQYDGDELQRLLTDPDPSERQLLPKFSAITWTLCPSFYGVHVLSLVRRAYLLPTGPLLPGSPAPGDNKERLIGLFKRAAMEPPWPELPERKEAFDAYLMALTFIDDLGAPEAALEISGGHVENVERRVEAANCVAKFYIYRLEWLLTAAQDCERDADKRSTYVAEAKEFMARATRSLRGLQPQDFDSYVRSPDITCLTCRTRLRACGG
jgi:hypothetical protein